MAQEIDLGSVVGPQGPGFSSATASVDATSGTPSVKVTKSGSGQDQSLAFAFSGLKGLDGDDGATPNVTATATVDATSGTPSVTVTRSGTDEAPKLAFAFKGLKGNDGAPGSAGKDGKTATFELRDGHLFAIYED